MTHMAEKLIGYLHNAFDKDPESQLAMRLNYSGSMTWQVEDELLTTLVSGGAGKNLTIDLGNTGLKCNGFNSYFYVPIDSTLSVYNSSLPLEIQADFSVPALPSVVSPVVSKNASYEIGVAADGRLAIRIETDEVGSWAWQYFTYVVPVNSFIESKIVYDGASIELYIDNELTETIVSGQLGSMTVNENNIFVGAAESSGSFAYSMAVKLYKLSIHNNNITSLSFPFNELFGKYLLDISGGKSDGIMVNVPVWETITISEIYAYISSQTDYSGVYLNSDITSLAGTALIDDIRNQSASNGDHFYIYTSLLWVALSAIGSVLSRAKISIRNMLEQASLKLAEGSWLNYWGDIFGFKKLSNEDDVSYRNRLIKDVTQVKSNNIALEKMIFEVTGLSVKVVNIDWVNNPGDILGQLGIADLKAGSPPSGGYPYWGNPIDDNPLVCTMAVIIGVASLSDISDLQKATIKSIIDESRSSGTYAKYYGPIGDFLHTNTAGDNTNDISKISGPSPPMYQEIIF